MPDDHPSGRPIREPRRVSLPICREPREEPLTPRLRSQSRALRIGFPISGEEDE